MEFEQLERFTAFLKENLSTPDFDEDAYLERLIIHWGETGALRFTLSAEETVSGAPAHIAYTVDNRYFIREDGKEIPVEDLDQAMEHMKEQGVEIVSGPFQPNPNTRFFFIHDPDGVNLEIIEKK